MNDSRARGRAVTRSSDMRVGPFGRPPESNKYGGGIEAGLGTYVDMFKRRWRWIAWTMFVVLCGALAYSLMRPPLYRATALLDVRGGGDSPSISDLFLAGDPSPRALQTRFGLMRSESLASRVIDQLGLDTLAEFNPKGTAERSEIVGKFLDRLIVDPVATSRLVKIHFDAENPELAAAITNAVVASYAELRVESHRDAVRRLSGQVDSVQARLAFAQDTLRAYASANALPYLVDMDLTAQITGRLDDLRGRLSDAEAERYASESMYDVVVRDGRVDLLEDEGLQVLTLRLSELRREHARVSATFTEAYPAAAELTRQIAQVRELVVEEQSRLAGRVESDYRLSLQREAKLVEAIDSGETMANELGPQSGDYYVLRQAVLADRAVYTTLLDSKRQAEIVAAIGATDIAVVDDAAPPAGPYRPVFGINIGLALMLGLVLGIGVALGKEFSDDTVRSAEDFPGSADIPVLAMIPSMPDGIANGSPRPPPNKKALLPWPGWDEARARDTTGEWLRIDTIDRRDPTSNALADSFGALRTAVLFTQTGPIPRSILVSSCRAGEGKTTVSVNLAVSMAQVGNRVLLIDADLRRPSVHRALRIPAGPGLVDCLDTGTDWREVVRSSVTPGLDVITSGGSSSRAGDLLGGALTGSLLREAEEAYDYVIVDAPALFINASDARLLSGFVDGVVMVVRSRSTPRSLIDRISETIPNIIGIVMNDLRKDSLPGYYAEYFHDYQEVGSESDVDRGWSPGPVTGSAVVPNGAGHRATP